MFRGKLKSILSYLIIIILVIVLSGVLTFNFVLNNWQTNPDNHQNENKSQLVNLPKEFNLLLLGVDEKKSGLSRSDTLMVAQVNLMTEDISLLSIPRDTRVKFKDGKHHKINAAYSYGGLNLVQDTITSFLGLKIDYYIKINYNDFIDLVNLMGGLELIVDKNLEYEDQAADLRIDLAAGKQVLNGEEALEYVRFRHDHLGDIGRIKRQQKFLRAVTDKLISPTGMIKLPKLLVKIRDSLEMNLPLTDIKGIVDLIQSFNLSKIKTATLPGRTGYINGISYWLVQKKK